MARKVSFDPVNRLIIEELSAVVGGESVLQVDRDIYSQGKVDHGQDANFNKHDPAFRASIGNDPLTPSENFPNGFFLQNQAQSGPSGGWRFRPAEVDHTIEFVGNLLREDVNLPLFTPTLGGYTVLITGFVRLAQTVTFTGVPQRAVAWSNFQFSMVLSIDHASPATGKTPTGVISKDDATIFTPLQLSAVEKNKGVYRWPLTAADMDFDTATLVFEAADADPVLVTIRTGQAQ